MYNFLVLVSVGAVGFLIFYILRFPTPSLLGPLFSIIVFSRLGLSMGELNSSILFVLQAILGIYVGIEIRRENLECIKNLYKPALLTVMWTFLITLSLGIILIKSGKADSVTAFLSSSPAGITEMSMLALSVGANVTTVTVFQLSRSIFTLTLVPVFIGRFLPNKKKVAFGQGVKKQVSNVLGLICWEKLAKIKTGIKDYHYLLTIALSLVGAFAAKYFSLPGGAMIGSFFLITILSLLGVNLKRPPKMFKSLIMMGVGISIGTSVIKSQWVDIVGHLQNILLFLIVIFLTTYGMYKIVKRVTGWDDLTCILATSPAGITPMTIIALENDSNPLEVSMMQLTRLLTVKVIIWPIVLFLI